MAKNVSVCYKFSVIDIYYFKSNLDEINIIIKYLRLVISLQQKKITKRLKQTRPELYEIRSVEV